jgi:hypothetical protein
MSQGIVEQALGKLFTDDAFRACFFAEPAGASLAAGLALSPGELAALAHLSQPALARFSRRLDARIRRLPVEAVPQATPAGERDGDNDGPRLRRARRGGADGGISRTPPRWSRRRAIPPRGGIPTRLGSGPLSSRPRLLPTALPALSSFTHSGSVRGRQR